MAGHEFSLRAGDFIVWWGPSTYRRSHHAGMSTVMLTPFPYQFDLPYGCTSAFCEVLWQEAPMDERITLMFRLFAGVVTTPDVTVRDAERQFSRIREFQPLLNMGWMVFEQKRKRSGRSMSELLLDDIADEVDRINDHHRCRLA